MTTDLSPGELAERIRSYLIMGGLFNPELALHDRVSELIQDCGKLIAQQGQDLARVTAERDALREAERCWTVAEKRPNPGSVVLYWSSGLERWCETEADELGDHCTWLPLPKPPAR